MASAACQAVGNVMLRLNARCSLCQTFCARAAQTGSFITVWEPESWRRPQARLASSTATHATSSHHCTAAAHVRPSPMPSSNMVPQRLHSSQKPLCRAGAHSALIRPLGHGADHIRDENVGVWLAGTTARPLVGQGTLVHTQWCPQWCRDGAEMGAVELASMCIDLHASRPRRAAAETPQASSGLELRACAARACGDLPQVPEEGLEPTRP